MAHLVLLGLAAVLVGAVTVPMHRSRGGSFIDLNGAFLALLWISFVAHAVISSIGVVRAREERSVSSVFVSHGVSLVLSIPAAVVLMVLGAFLF